MNANFRERSIFLIFAKCFAVIILVAGIVVGISSCSNDNGVETIADDTPGQATDLVVKPDGSDKATQFETSSAIIDSMEYDEKAQEETDLPDDSKQHIPWQFFTYAEPDFASAKLDSMPPSDVDIIEKREDGWALIETNDGTVWVYLDKNLVYVDRWVSLYSEIGDGIAIGDQGPQVVEIIERQDNWTKISTEHGENWIDMDSIRQAVRLDVPSYDQRELGYPLGCEMVALAMMMNYEHEVSVHDLVDEMPRADHPDEGFRGEPSSSSRGWTIFPPALAGMMEKHLGNSYDMSGFEMEDLKEQLNANKPVLVWVSGLGWAVHALCLSGYDDAGFYYNDPWTGQKDTPISYNAFYEVWNTPIYDRVLDLTYTPRKAMSYYDIADSSDAPQG